MHEPLPIGSLIHLAAGGGGVPPLVRDIGICVLLAGLLSILFTRLKIPSIAAFLVAGVVAGPAVASLVDDPQNMSTIAGLGLVLLLFLIGLEIDVRKLLSSGRALILAGLLQFPLCVAFGFAAAHACEAAGFPLGEGSRVPLYVGFTAAASSTLLVVRLLQSTGRMDTVVGRLCLGVLIFQDLWAIIVLAVQPSFEKPEIGTVVSTFVGIGLLAAVALALARWVLPTAFRWIATVPELFLVAATGWCFGIALLGNNLGSVLGSIGIDTHLSVSLEMGALLAGASIASLPYSAQVVSKVGVMYEFFITLFFVGLGMQIPRPDGVYVLGVAVVLAVICIAARAFVFLPLFHLGGSDGRTSFVTSTKLSQVSEFCLVIAYLGQGFGHVTGTFVSAVIFAFVITALLSPLLFHTADGLYVRVEPLLVRLGLRAPPPMSHGDGHDGADIVLLGCHRVASSLLWEIEKKRPDLRSRTLVIDFNVAIHEDVAARGFAVMYGDFSNDQTLHHCGVPEARVVVSTVSDDLLKGTSNLKIVRLVRSMAPNTVLVATALTAESARELYAAGADLVLLPRIEAAQGLLPGVIDALEGRTSQARMAFEARYGALDARKEVLP
jgi:Kef-type K+ transport system membrane component KefB